MRLPTPNELRLPALWTWLPWAALAVVAVMWASIIGGCLRALGAAAERAEKAAPCKEPRP